MTTNSAAECAAEKRQKTAIFGNKPRWLKVKAPTSRQYRNIKQIVKNRSLNTVCESASCPNIGQCWHEGAAAFMILGGICTRNCTFCDVPTGRPEPVDEEEPERLAEAASAMALRHVVITSVDRDDLVDGGAGQFVECIKALRAIDPKPTIEVLTPDFKGKPGALDKVLAQRPEVFNHNVETVPGLYSQVRPAADYRYSLQVLTAASRTGDGVVAKSGMMLGLGESDSEIMEVLGDLRRAGVSYLTLGQYLRPSLQHRPVDRYLPPEEFDRLRQSALDMGFKRVESHPLARSSFHAER